MTDNFNDVSSAFNGWLQALTGTRSTGSYVNGRWVASGGSITFNGVVQNANPNDMLSLPEGQREEEAIKIHTVFELTPQDGTTTGDIISYKGENWLVYSVARRYIGGYNKAIAIKQL